MLTIGSDYVSKNISEKVEFRLLGQEVNPRTHSVCQSDMLILDRDPDDIVQGSTLSKDGYKAERFDYMITNPPYGKKWSSEKNKPDFKKELDDPNGRFHIGVPPVTDGQLLFVQHLISKMEPKGSRIGVVLNGSPLFTGDSGSGSSEIRKWIIENDWLESIIRLPDQLFFNTGITTYIWILSNKKPEERKGKVQLIDGFNFFRQMKVSLNKKRKEITDSDIKKIQKEYLDFKESDTSLIYENNFFSYTRVQVEQPLTEGGEIVTNSKGQPKPDTSKRDYERIPYGEDIDEYFDREVKPYLKDSWMDRSKDNIGYEINFPRYFYKFTPIRSLGDITQDLRSLEGEIQQSTDKINE